MAASARGPPLDGRARFLPERFEPVVPNRPILIELHVAQIVVDRAAGMFNRSECDGEPPQDPGEHVDGDQHEKKQQRDAEQLKPHEELLA